jgi:hypothetical protein
VSDPSISDKKDPYRTLGWLIKIEVLLANRTKIRRMDLEFIRSSLGMTVKRDQ